MIPTHSHPTRGTHTIMSYPKFDVGDQAAGPPTGSNYPAPRQGHGCFFWGCIISLIVSGLGLILMVGGAALLWNFANNQIKQYTDTAPAPIPAVTATDTQKTEIKHRWAAFKKAVEEGKEAELVLTADDLNRLVQQEPKLKDRVFFAIKGDDITAQVSYPLADFKNPLFNLEGRYLNGTATVSAQVDEDGHLDIRLDEIEVKGKKMPPDVKAQLSSEFSRSFSRDPETQRLLRKLRSIKVKNDKITLKSRGKEGQDATDKTGAADIEAQVIAIVSEELNVPKEKVTPTTSFKDLKADDQDVTDLFLELQDEFDLEFPDDAAARFKNVGQVIDYIQSNQGKAAGKKAEGPAKKAKVMVPEKAKEADKAKEPEKVKAKEPAGSTPGAQFRRAPLRHVA